MRDRQRDTAIRKQARADLRDAIEGFIELGEVENLVSELQSSAEVIGVSDADFDAAVKHYQNEAAWRAENDDDDDGGVQ
jgi:hypothetical protein